MRFLGHYEIPWIWQWSFYIASRNGLLMLVRNYFYKWWPKFDYFEISQQITNDIQSYIYFNNQVDAKKKLKKLLILKKLSLKPPLWPFLKINSLILQLKN